MNTPHTYNIGGTAVAYNLRVMLKNHYVFSKSFVLLFIHSRSAFYLKLCVLFFTDPEEEEYVEYYVVDDDAT